jgi:Tol biopolymer transport system component
MLLLVVGGLLAEVPAVGFRDPALGRDGRALAVSWACRVAIVDLDSGKARVLAGGAPVPQRYPCWSPDGKEIAFSAHVNERFRLFRVPVSGGGSHLYAVQASGGAARRLTEDASRDTMPRVSPDGRRVAFASDRSGEEEIWVLHLEEGEVKRVTRLPNHTGIVDFGLTPQQAVEAPRFLVQRTEYRPRLPPLPGECTSKTASPAV